MKYELLYKEGDHGREVSPERSSTKGWGPEEHPGLPVPEVAERGV